MQYLNSEINSYVLGTHYWSSACMSENPQNWIVMKQYLSFTLVCRLYKICLFFFEQTICFHNCLFYLCKHLFTYQVFHSLLVVMLRGLEVGFIFEGFEKSRVTKGSTVSEWVRVQGENGRVGSKQQRTAGSSYAALPSKKLLIRHRAGHKNHQPSQKKP